MNKLLCLLALCVLGISRIRAAQKAADNSWNDQYADDGIYMEDREQYGDLVEGSAVDEDYSGAGSNNPFRDDEDSREGSADYNVPVDKMTKCEEEYQRNKLSGSRRDEPQCTRTGEFAAKQCDQVTNECWCVNFEGQEIPGTISRPPWTPQCDVVDRTKMYQTNPVEPPIKAENKPNKVGNSPTDTNKDWNIDPTDENDGSKTENKNGGGVSVDTIDDPDKEHSQEDEDEHEGHHDTTKEQLSRDTGLLRQPLMLAGLIAIAVVCLLCAVLLVMFIVYRMRKKDEGSYALEEPTKGSRSHPYQRAPTREFFA